MAYKQKGISFGVGTGSSPLNKNGDPKKSDTQKKFENTNYDQAIYNMSGTYDEKKGKWSVDDDSKHPEKTIHAKSDNTRVR